MRVLATNCAAHLSCPAPDLCKSSVGGVNAQADELAATVRRRPGKEAQQMLRQDQNVEPGNTRHGYRTAQRCVQLVHLGAVLGQRITHRQTDGGAGARLHQQQTSQFDRTVRDQTHRLESIRLSATRLSVRPVNFPSRQADNRDHRRDRAKGLRPRGRLLRNQRFRQVMARSADPEKRQQPEAAHQQNKGVPKLHGRNRPRLARAVQPTRSAY